MPKESNLLSHKSRIAIISKEIKKSKVEKMFEEE